MRPGAHWRFERQTEGQTVAIAMGRGYLGAAGLWGEVIERATQIVERISECDAGVFLDDVAAGLLETRFDLERCAGVIALSAPREAKEAARTLLGKPVPFVGRERELATLEGFWNECVGESMARAVVVITGMAGMGKVESAA